MKTIETSNKLIAEFMGKKHDEICHKSFGGNFNFAFEYHESWDWLMPVVEKIDREFAGISMEIACRKGHGGLHTCTILGSFKHNNVDIMTYSENKLNTTYKAVIQFIKWYNQQQLNKKASNYWMK